MAVTPRRSALDDLRTAVADGLERAAELVRGAGARGDASEAQLEREVAELRDRIEYLEDSLAAYEARADRDESALRPWSEVRR